MKQRLSFVTNSSSSSFIIAVHKDTTENDLRKILKTKEDRIKEGIEYREETLDKATDKLIDDMMYTKVSGMKIGDYFVSGGRSSNEDGVIEDIYYNLPEINTDKLKLKDVG